MKTAILLAGVSSIALLSGCAQFRALSDSDYGVAALKFDKDSAAAKLQEALVKTERGSGMVDAHCFKTPVEEAKEISCRQQRNHATMVLLNVSDDQCQTHMRSIYGTEASFNIMMGTLGTLFSGAAAIAGSAAAKSSQAALATFFNAERSLVNETVYKNMLVTAVSKKIREGREAKIGAMLPGTFSKKMDEYPMPLAVFDVLQYHYTCSFMYGLEKALEEGVQSGTDGKRARLEQEKRSLELYMDTRMASLKIASVDAAKDPGLTGAADRIKEIEAQLLALTKTGTSATTTGKPAAKPPGG